ncbi:MAG: urease accessory protein UreD [Burkholderiaceae bacterium]
MNAPHHTAIRVAGKSGQLSQQHSGQPAVFGAASAPGQWLAGLNLGFQSRSMKAEGQTRRQTYASRREHIGPLRILKGFPSQSDQPDLYQQIIVHPPGGIAAGDELHINVHGGDDTHVLMTSPGAAKWYRQTEAGKPRSNIKPSEASQHLRVRIDNNASFEWMPLENIAFSGTRARLTADFHLANSAALICADVFCLGRPASNEVFEHGLLACSTRIFRRDQLLFSEQLRLYGGDRLLQSPAGLNGATSFGTLIAVPSLELTEDPGRKLESLRDAIREQWRELAADNERSGLLAVTALPECLIVRWTGHSAQAGWIALRCVWENIRQPLIGRPPIPPRIWAC